MQNSRIRYISSKEELLWLAIDDWECVEVVMATRIEISRAARWLADYTEGELAIYNKADRPRGGEPFWTDKLIGNGTHFEVYFADSAEAAMFKLTFG